MTPEGGSGEQPKESPDGDKRERPWAKLAAAAIAVVALVVSAWLGYSAFKGSAVAASFTRVGGVTRVETSVEAAGFWRSPPANVVITAFDRSGSAASERLLLAAARCAAADDAPVLFDAPGRAGRAVRPRLVQRLLDGWRAQRGGKPPRVLEIRAARDAAGCARPLAGSATAGLHTFPGDAEVVPALPAVNPRAKLAPFVVFAAPRAAHDVPDVAVGLALAAHLARPGRQVSLVVVPRYLESDPGLEDSLRGRRELVQGGVVLGATTVLPDDTRALLRQVLQPFNRAGLFGEVRTDLGSLGTAIAALAALLGAALATRTAAPLVASARLGLVKTFRPAGSDGADRVRRPAAPEPPPTVVEREVPADAPSAAASVPAESGQRPPAAPGVTTRDGAVRDAMTAAVTLGWYVAALAQVMPVAATSAAATGVGMAGFDDRQAREYCALCARAAHAGLLGVLAEVPVDLDASADRLSPERCDLESRDQAAELDALLLAELGAADLRLGQAYGLGGALLRLTTRPSADARVADHLRDQAVLAATVLEDLTSALPAHAARAVRISLLEWVEVVRDRRDSAAEPEQWARLSRQGFVWFTLLTGARRGEDVLEHDDYVAVGDGLTKAIRTLAMRLARGSFALIALVVAVMAAGVVLMLVVRTAAALVTGAVLLVAGLGVLWRGASTGLRIVVRRAEEPLWNRELDAAIARAISVAATPDADLRAQTRREAAALVGGGPSRRGGPPDAPARR